MIVTISVLPFPSSTVSVHGYGAIFGNVTGVTVHRLLEDGEPLENVHEHVSESFSGSVDVDVNVI